MSPDEIPEGQNTLICKLSASSAVPAKLYSLQMIAEPIAAESGAVPTLVRTLPLIDRRRVNVDLIPYALREDQRRLPAPLTDRLAILVTPPAPFTMELTEPLVALGRYQYADIPITTTRSPGFDGAITFTARGGQLADKNDVRTRVYAEFPMAMTGLPHVTGRIHSRILSQIGQTRIDVEGTAVHQGRRIALDAQLRAGPADCLSDQRRNEQNNDRPWREREGSSPSRARQAVRRSNRHPPGAGGRLRHARQGRIASRCGQR